MKLLLSRVAFRTLFRSISFCLAGTLTTVAGQEIVRYHFVEGEALAYETKVMISEMAATKTDYFEHKRDFRNKADTTFEFSYELMPIAFDGLWKVRLVLDRVEESSDRDGEVVKTSFNRDALQKHQVSASEIMNLNIWELDLPGKSPAEDTEASDQNKSSTQARTADDLFDQPILTWFQSDGTIHRFEDRTELHQVMPGLDLKACIQLTMPTLPALQLGEGSAWIREEPVNLPAEPLDGQKGEPLIMKVNYTVKRVEEIDDRSCARIVVTGQFRRGGLWIPIEREEKKHLTWTTFLSSLEDRIEGEFVYDLEQQIIRSSVVTSTYGYSTIAGRKEDDYRGRIVSEKTMRTQLFSTLVETPPASASAEKIPGSIALSQTLETSEKLATERMNQ